MSASLHDRLSQRVEDLTERTLDLLPSMPGSDGDMVGFAPVLAKTLRRAALRPLVTGQAMLRYATGVAQATTGTALRAVGRTAEDPVTVDPRDRRFADEAWEDSPVFHLVLQQYLLLRRLVDETVEAGAPDGIEGDKARMGAAFVLDMLAPTNMLFTNPVALQTAVETHGRSLLTGMQHFMDDLVNNSGRPSQVDRTPFTVGGNLACTPGKVVFRNALIELIQYEAQTEKVFSTPLLLSPPWINKYYVMDLAPGRSFAEWAVQHGHTVFAISYRNPTPEMSDTGMEDYLTDGLLTAVDVVREITGVKSVNVAALCLGGTLTTIMLGHLANIGQSDHVKSVTLLNTLTDFADSGPLTCFTDVRTVERLEEKMAETGLLDGAEMRSTFDMLRANDLIFNYVVSNWLLGKTPPAFDILAWNDDTTNMPAKMHSFYLRQCYVDNRLVKGELEVLGDRIDLGKIPQDVFIVGAVNDHIAPWETTFRGIQRLTSADVTYVLSSAGHIAGVVNPPSPKASYRTREGVEGTPQEWLDGTEEVQASWWEPWAEWIGARAGRLRAARVVGSAANPAICDAPGTYVLE